MILKFFKLLKKIKYLDNNIKKKIIVFDSESIEQLKMYVLKNFDYFVIDNRYEKITLFLSYNLLIKFIKNFCKFFSKKDLLIQDIYFLTLIELINPKLVLTVIEANIQFSRIAKYSSKSIKFMTLQLTNLVQRNIMNYLYRTKKLKKNLLLDYYYPIYLGFGKYQKENLEKNNIKVKKFVNVGCLNLANFQKLHKYKNKKIYDICLVSDDGAFSDKYGDDNIQISQIKKIEKKFMLLIKWTIKLVKNKKLKFIFIFKRSFDSKAFTAEKNYYKKNLDKDEFKFLMKNSSCKSNNNIYNSYDKSSKSKLSLAVSSTLLTENLIAGNKILSCNFTGLAAYNFPIDGICTFNEENYSLFQNRVLKIIKMSNYDYYKKLSRNRNYLAKSQNPNKTINLIKKEIHKCIY